MNNLERERVNYGREERDNLVSGVSFHRLKFQQHLVLFYVVALLHLYGFYLTIAG